MRCKWRQHEDQRLDRLANHGNRLGAFHLAGVLDVFVAAWPGHRSPSAR
jgi:hypothetical protein